jgi:cell division topological specificity factor
MAVRGERKSLLDKLFSAESGMSFFNRFQRRTSAPIARAGYGKSDLLVLLREEILAAIAKYILVERDNVQVQMDRGDTVSTLDINVEIQHSTDIMLAAGLDPPVRNNRVTA